MPSAGRRGTTRRGRRSAAPAISTTRRSRSSSCAAAGAERVAVVDLDAHHGNGTQAMFYDRADVLYASLHVDPGAGWFPHVVGFADERGRGDGRGDHPQPPARARAPVTRAGSPPYARSVLPSSDFAPDAVVVSLGLDAAKADPESPLEVTERRLPRGRARCWPGSARRWPCRRVATTSTSSVPLAVAALDGLAGPARPRRPGARPGPAPAASASRRVAGTSRALASSLPRVRSAAASRRAAEALVPGLQPLAAHVVRQVHEPARVQLQPHQPPLAAGEQQVVALGHDQLDGRLDRHGWPRSRPRGRGRTAAPRSPRRPARGPGAAARRSPRRRTSPARP